VSAGAAAGRRTLLTTLVDYLVEPLEPVAAGRTSELSSCFRPTVAVIGIGPGCGTTTVARALAVELALRDPCGAGAVTSRAVPSGGIPLGTAAAGRLAHGLEDRLHARTRVAGRVCLVGAAERPALTAVARDLAPLVIDVDDASDAPIAASLADVVVLVASPPTESSLARLLAASLARVGPQPQVVVNRACDVSDRWKGTCVLRLPESRMGARLAFAGREARGPLGGAIAHLADLVEVAA
jgi:hypothetical protein